MEGAVVRHDLAGEECQADDDQEKCVETGASDEQTGPEAVSLVITARWTQQALQTNCQESDV